MKISLREARLAKNMTQKDLAQQVGRTPQTIAMWETGQVKLSAEMFLYICQILEVNPNNIFLPHESSLS